MYLSLPSSPPGEILAVFSPSDELGNSTSPFLFLQFELPPNILTPLAAGSPEVQVGLQGSDFSGSPITSVQAYIPGQRLLGQQTAWRAQLPAWGLDLRGLVWKVSQEGGVCGCLVLADPYLAL